jgi:hypothetical protein
MDLPRTFVSFSSTDIGRYRLMCAWKAHEHIDFNFADFQLDEAINSENEYYIKQTCRNKIRMADTFVLLIGSDTYTKTTFVKWEVDVAIGKGCRLIGVNITNCRFKDSLCPYFFADKGAVFAPFSSRIVAESMKPHRFDLLPGQTRDFHFYDHIYTGLGYQLIGDTAVLPPPLNPFQFGRPPWAR